MPFFFFFFFFFFRLYLFDISFDFHFIDDAAFASRLRCCRAAFRAAAMPILLFVASYAASPLLPSALIFLPLSLMLIDFQRLPRRRCRLLIQYIASTSTGCMIE